MKKLISLVLVFCMFMGTLVYTIPSGAVTYGYTKGDADDSSDLSTKDVLLVRKNLAGLVSEKELNRVAADADTDGDLTTKDVLYIRKMLAGLIDEEGNNTDDRYNIDTVTIADKNINRYTIVVTDSSNQCMSYSAGELRKYIREACGVSLNIVYKDVELDTYKIKYVFDTEDNFSLGKEGYRVAVEDNGDVVFYCGSLRGPLYVTYFFLEDFLGYRFLFGKNIDGSEMDPYLYKSDSVNLPMGYDETEVPILSYRAASQGGCTSFNFPMMRTNAVDGKGSGSAGNVKYGGGVGTAVWHGHSYMWQVEGITEHTQPCLSDDSTYEQVLAECVGQVTWRKEAGQYLGVSYTQLSVSPNDNTNFCKCSSCMAVYTKEGSIAGTVFRLSNRVAEALGEMYPGVEVFTIAYWDARNPPKFTRPHENVCVCFCIGGCNNHPYDQTELCEECGGNPRLSSVDFNGNAQPQSNALDIAYYERWAELTDNIYIWYYSANFNYYVAPAPNIFNIYNDFRYLAATGTEGVYCEGSSRPYYSFEYLRGYLVSKMMWNPFMSEEEFNSHLDEFLMLYYGEGWESVREFLEMTDYASDLNGCWTNNFDRPWNTFNEGYFLEHYHELRALLDEAYDKASNSEFKNRVQLLYFHCDFLGLSATYERDWVNGDEQTKAEYERRYAFLYNLMNSKGLSVTSFGLENAPKSASDIMDPMRWIFDDFTGYWEWTGTSWQ